MHRQPDRHTDILYEFVEIFGKLTPPPTFFNKYFTTLLRCFEDKLTEPNSKTINERYSLSPSREGVGKLLRH